MAQGTLAAALAAMASAVESLADDLASTEGTRALLADLGVVADSVPAALLDLGPLLADVTERASDLRGATGVAELVAAVELSTALAALSRALVGLGPALSAQLPVQPDGTDTDEIGRALLDRLTLEHLARHAGALHELLRAVGGVSDGLEPVDGLPDPDARQDDDPLGPETDHFDGREAAVDEPTPNPPVTRRRRLELDRLTGLADDVAGALTAAFAWGTADFDGDAALERLAALVRALGIDAAVQSQPRPPGDVDDAGTVRRALHVRLAALATRTGFDEVGVDLVALPPTTPGGGDAGLGIRPPRTAGMSAVPVSDEVSLTVDGTGTWDDRLLSVRPPLSFAVTDDDGRPATAAGFSVTVHLRPSAGVTLLRESGLVTLAADGVDVTTGVVLAGGEPTMTVSAALTGGTLELGTGSADTFLRHVLPADGIVVPFDVGLAWSRQGGITLIGTTGLVITRTLTVRIGPITVDELRVVLVAGPTGDGILTLDVSASLAIGPFAATVEHVGLVAAVRITMDGGNLGLLDVDPPAFLPPERVTFRLDTEGVSGGGFVGYDRDLGRYSGGLVLDVFGLGISAVVVVDTRLPRDPDGWALFASLGATFPSPVPLGFGFTLLGVGGLLALNRTIDVDELAGALRTGAADALLFPDDILDDPDALLDSLDHWFPLRDGTTVVGPVLAIGWGSPTIITIQLGVIVAIPDLVVTLLGSLELFLPTPDDAVLTLHMDVLGAVDVPAGTITVAASLYDSNLLGLQLSGDMGFYARLTGQPLFVLSVGGYHPQFDPPGAIPAWLLDLRVMRAAIDLGDGIEIVCESYVAVTSNTFQFGGRVEVTASVKVLVTTYTAQGWFGVNVLLTLTPFAIVADVSAGVAVSAGTKELFGVDLYVHLEGPRPWYAMGRATFRFFGLNVDLLFDVGSTPGGAVRGVHPVADDVVAALADPRAWQAVDGAGAWTSGVTLSPELPAGLWVRPDQAVEVRQSVAPLNRTITAFGEYVPAEPTIDVTDVTLGGEPVEEPQWAQDWFAPAQFDRLDAGARLSMPSYELMTAGVRFGDDEVDVGSDPARLCTSVSREPEQSVFGDRRPTHASYVSPVHVAAAAPVRRTVTGSTFAVRNTAYTLVQTATGERAGAALADAGRSMRLTYADAVTVLTARVAADTSERGRLRVAPAHAALAEVVP